MALTYQGGFGNHFESEAIAGALPVGRNSPQKTPFGLYAEQLSGSAFTAPRGENRHSWLYRLRPSAAHPPFAAYAGTSRIDTADGAWAPVPPNRLRWNPLPFPAAPTDFVDGLVTMGGAGRSGGGWGLAIHLYAANSPMTDRAFFDADGELLIVPQEGALAVTTEMGRLDVAPGEVVLIPCGVRFTVAPTTGAARGYVCETFGAPFRLPELGPIGSNGLANPRDFLAPTAWFEDRSTKTELVQKFAGKLWRCGLDHSPFDVVAWHGNLTPCKYDLARFNTMNTVSFDHPDPSIFTVLTSPSDTPGVANCDFVIFPPRWLVAEDTFRPPWFHRNVMSEFMGLVRGAYDAKAEGFTPGGASLHNRMSAHGPDMSSYRQAVAAELEPHRIEGTLAFMFETRWPLELTPWATGSDLLQTHYDDCWQGFPKAEPPTAGGGS